jgi:hypothetical protein
MLDMERQHQEKVHRLVVTGPLRDRLYERFAELYKHSADVEVVKDRRYAERRRAVINPSDDRRRTDRRRGGADWVFPPESA